MRNNSAIDCLWSSRARPGIPLEHLRLNTKSNLKACKDSRVIRSAWHRESRELNQAPHLLTLVACGGVYACAPDAVTLACTARDKLLDVP